MSRRVVLSVLLVVLASLLVGCGGGLRFVSKTGRKHDRLAPLAVLCDEAEAQAVVAAGAQVIGSISAKNRDFDDHTYLAESAQKIAAKRGGTHVVLTERGEDAFLVTATGEMLVASRRQASFVVLRLSPLKWDSLPPALRPVPRD